MFGCILIVYYDHSFVYIYIYIYMYVANLGNRDSVILCIVYVCSLSLFENFHFVINDNFLQDKGEECQDPPCLCPLSDLRRCVYRRT